MARGEPNRTEHHPNRRASESFRRAASKVSDRLGSHLAFFAAVAIVLGWLLAGPLFHFSDSWQLFINTGTTIVTFLMVFLIQATQNRDAKATQLKLDELIRSSRARNVFADLENATEEEILAFQKEFRTLREQGLEKQLAARVAQSVTQPHEPHPATKPPSVLPRDPEDGSP